MRQQGWGRIINISGLAVRQTGSTIGSIRNVAVAAMSKNLADELGHYGINVTVVHSGLTRTESADGVVVTQAQIQGISLREVERLMAQNNSVRQIIDARDVADVVVLLASPIAVAINRDVVPAGGGVGRAIHY